MHRTMRLRCLLRPSLWCEPATPAVASSNGGGFLVRRLGAPLRPCGERRRLCRFYSSKQGVGSAEAAAAAGTPSAARRRLLLRELRRQRGGGSAGGDGSGSSEQEHARLGERDQQEWLSGERFPTGCKRRELPFLTKRDRFRNEFLRRVVCHGIRPASRGTASRTTSRTELYRERLVRALANELPAPLLVLDSSVLAPYDCGEDCSECEEEDSHAGSEDGGSESEVEGEGNEESGESNDDDAIKSVADLRKLVPCTLEEFAKVSIFVEPPYHKKE